MGLYHYSTRKNRVDLMDADRLVPSKIKQQDSIHGPGWYLTDLGPAVCQRSLMRHCGPRTGAEQRVRHYVEVELDEGRAVRLRKHVYFVPESSSARFRLVSQGEVLECMLKPCEACPLNPERR